MGKRFAPHCIPSRKFIGFLLVALAAAGAELPPEMAGGAEAVRPARALQADMRSVWKPERETIELAAGDAPNRITLRFPPCPRPKDTLVVMRFRLRMVSKSFGGWNNFLCLSINDKPVATYTEAGDSRLLNRRGTAMKTSSPKWPNEAYFRRTNGSAPALLTIFGPSWDTLEPRFVQDRRELYWFLLDITDLVHTDTDNTLTLTNVALARLFKKSVEEMKAQPMLIDRLEIGLVGADVREQLTENLRAAMTGFRPTVSVRGGGIELAASAGGAVRIGVAGERYFLRSAFSEAGPTIRSHRFWWTAGKDWRVRVERAGPGKLVLTGICPSYTWRRTLRLDGQFVRIEETVTNTADTDIGIMIRHELLCGTPAVTWRLSGLPNEPVYSDVAANPTLFFRQQKTGLGAAMLDTVMRGQMVEEGGKRTLAFDNSHFGLARGKSTTIIWSLRVGGPDFWEFINAVRDDWGANNATIPGMYSFWRPEINPHKALMEDPEKLRAYLTRKRIDIFSLSPWFEYYSPAKYWRPRSVYKAFIRKTMATIRAVEPEAKFLANTETFLYYAPASFFKGTLPAYWTEAKGRLPRGPKRPHDYILSVAATAVIDASPWKDSVFRDPDGRAIIDLYYAGAYQDGGVNLKLYPTLDNYWFGKFKEMIDFLLDDCGLDGIYIDSFSYYHNRTYDHWDGHSVDINAATGAITGKYARLGILTAPARAQWVRSITDRGKICYVNGKRSTRELQSLPQIGFMEAEWTFNPAAEPLCAPRAAKAQLSAPLALGVRPQRWPEHTSEYAQILQKAVIAYLRHGALYCHYTSEIPPPDQPGGGEYGILNHMVPFTPVELHEGWVVGKERILTAVSGTFTWPHADKPRCLRFDLRGMPVKGGFTLQRTAKGWRIEVSLKDWRETAVIE